MKAELMVAAAPRLDEGATLPGGWMEGVLLLIGAGVTKLPEIVNGGRKEDPKRLLKVNGGGKVKLRLIGRLKLNGSAVGGKGAVTVICGAPTVTVRKTGDL